MRVSLTLTEMGGGLEVNLRLKREQKRRRGEDRRPSAIDANRTSWHAQTVWADIVGVGKVPPHFVNTCSNRDSAREGEQDGRDGSPHWQLEGEGETRDQKFAWVSYLSQAHTVEPQERRKCSLFLSDKSVGVSTI